MTIGLADKRCLNAELRYEVQITSNHGDDRDSVDGS